MKQVVFLLLISSVTFAETILLGVKDDFSASNGAEVLSINDSLVQSGYSGLADTTTVNAQIAASFDISAYAGNITGATIKILKKPLNDSGGEDNDRLIILVGDQDINSGYPIALGWDGGANSYFDWDWRVGSTPTPVDDGFLIEIDLSQFNSVNATDISIIDQMNAATSLSFVCGSDSSWDYLELTLQAGQIQVVVDSDGDGLSDSDEVNTHGTDPNDSDSDDDGVNDGDEITNGTSPLINVSDGLVGHYTFDGSALDISGNGNHATLYNIDYAESYISTSQSIEFNGSTSWAEIIHSSSLAVDGEYSLSYWSKLDPATFVDNYRGYLISKGDGGNNNEVYTHEIRGSSINGPTLGHRWNTGISGQSISYGEVFIANDQSANWHCVTVTHESGYAPKIYINGIEKESYSSNRTSHTILETMANVYLGCNARGGGNPAGNELHHKGLFDNFRIYNKVLNAQEVEEIYTIEKPIDSDGDGLSDSDEVNTYGTDPNDSDSDDDGFSDIDEITKGWDPNNATMETVPVDSWEQLGEVVSGNQSEVDYAHPQRISLSKDGRRFAWANKSSGIEVYELSSNAWVKIGQSINTGGQQEAKVALSSDGSYLLFGSGMLSSASVYQFADGDWNQVGASLSRPGTGFGNALAISDNGGVIAVGEWLNDEAGENAGKVFIYQLENGEWTLFGEILGKYAGDHAARRSLDLSANGHRIAIDNYGSSVPNGSHCGNLRVYEYDQISGDWYQLGDDISGLAYDDRFSTDVAISSDGSVVAGGAYRNDPSGHVRVFEWNDSVWVQRGQTLAGEGAGDRFGFAVSLSSSGSRIAVGGYWNDENGQDAGHVRIFDYDGSSWVQIGEDIDGLAVNDQFGHAVSISGAGDTLAVSSVNGSGGVGSAQLFTGVALWSPTNEYHLIEHELSWTQCLAYARYYGGELAAFTSQAEEEYVTSWLDGQIGEEDSEVFLGGSDQDSEGVWTWSSDETWEYENWYAGEPNDQNGNEDYLQLTHNSVINWDWKWNDFDGNGADATYYMLIESSADASIPTGGVITTSTDSDGDGLTDIAEIQTYGTDPNDSDSDDDGLSDGYEIGIGRYTYISTSLTWDNARVDAVSRGGHLATITTQEEWDYLLTLGLTNQMWLGGTDLNDEGNWRWLTREIWSFNKWGINDPDNYNGNEYQLLTIPGISPESNWNDEGYPGYLSGYLLEVGYFTNPSNPDSDEDGLSDSEEITYLTVPNNSDSDGDGLSDGDEVNTHGTDPNDADSDNDGLNDGDEVNTHSTDPRDSDSDDDGLSDGDEINIYGTDPNDADSDDDGLSDGNELMNTYELIIGNFNPNSAASDANNRGGYLATITSTQEWNFIQSLINTNITYWLGGNDVAVEGQWVWNNGESWEVDFWGENQPDNGNGGSEPYLTAVHNNGQNSWNDTESFYSLSYLLEVNKSATDPNNADSDYDGVSDGDEINIYGTDPNTSERLYHFRFETNNIINYGSASIDVQVNGATWRADGEGDGLYEFNPPASMYDSNQPYLGMGVSPEGFPIGDFTLAIKFKASGIMPDGTLIGSGANEYWNRFWWLSRNKFEWWYVPGVSSGGVDRKYVRVSWEAGELDQESTIILSRQGTEVDVWLNGLQSEYTITNYVESYFYVANPLPPHQLPAEPMPVYDYGLMIGNMLRDAGSTRWQAFSGEIDEVIIYDKGLSDAEARQLSTQMGIAPADTNDSDDDGLSDGDEITNGTDPNNADTDGDGLSDGDEVNTHGTDPNDIDSDDDGVNDGDEVGNGSDPLDPNSPDGNYNLELQFKNINSAFFNTRIETNNAIGTGCRIELLWSDTNALNTSYGDETILVSSITGAGLTDKYGLGFWHSITVNTGDLPSESGYVWTRVYNQIQSRYIDLAEIDILNMIESLSEDTLIKTPDSHHAETFYVMEIDGVVNPVADSDDDGLLDTEELQRGTDPHDSDTDNDELSDGDEVLTFGSNPNLIDSDGDGFPDNIEVSNTIFGLDVIADSSNVVNFIKEMNQMKPELVGGAMSMERASSMMRDLRIGSQTINVSNEWVRLQLILEESPDKAESWTNRQEIIEVDVPATNSVQFYRFKME